MNQAEAVERLVSGPACTAAEAPARVPRNSGYYAVYVDDAKHLPSPYRDLLLQRVTDLVYIGIATTSLSQRLVEQDLRHRGPSTFFRGIGAILGYRPQQGSLVGRKNQNNYRFSVADTAAITRWIDAHLSISWAEAKPAHRRIESSLIRQHRPILNTTHNPESVAELAALRAECRRIAAETPGPAGRGAR
jgi:hypothetical protein